MIQNQPLLEVIRENIRNGELPDTFSLPRDYSEPGKVKWADGAFDGVGIYHMGAPQITEEHLQIIADAFSAPDDHEKVKAGMKDFFAQVVPLRGIDAIQQYILEHTAVLPAETIYQLAIECLSGPDIDFVKLGMILIEIFSEPEDDVKDMIRTLGLSDEFTIFALFNMQRWQNGNEEVFALARKVHGWGRIHAVDRLNPETQEIRDWLLAEGIDNNIMQAYSALEVYRKTDIAALLKTDVTDAQLDQIAGVLLAMFDEGPVKGISALPEEDAKAMIGSFITRAETQPATLRICELLRLLSGDERFRMYFGRSFSLLNSLKCRELISQELTNGNAVDLAKATGLPYKEKIFAHMQADFEKGFGNCGSLMDDEQYRARVIDLFRNALPLQTMIRATADENGFNGQSLNYHKLSFLLQFLNPYPLCGTDLVLAALKMPADVCRTQAIRTISEWCTGKQCSLSELSDEVYQAVEQFKSAETDERIKKYIAEIGL